MRYRFQLSIITALLILLYSYTAVSKLTDMAAFRGQLYNQSFPHAVADGLLIALPMSELLTAGLLWFPRSRYWGLLASTGLLVIFTGYVALVLLGYWDRVPCSCGGVLAGMNWPVHLAFNLIFLLLSSWALWAEARSGIAAQPAS